MIDLYGVLQEQETVNGELGLGVDYYKGEKGEQGIPGKDGSDQVYVGADEPTDERVKLWIDTDATPPSKAVSWDEIENKPEIPAPYTLPTASTSTLGGVKVDGNTITIADGVISAKSGGGGGGSGEWHYTTNFNESDLYNAKELVIFYQQTSTMKLFCEHYIFVKRDGTQGTLGVDFSNQYFGMFYSPDTALWDYNGSHFSTYNLSYKWQALAYKT